MSEAKNEGLAWSQNSALVVAYNINFTKVT